MTHFTRRQTLASIPAVVVGSVPSKSDARTVEHTAWPTFQGDAENSGRATAGTAPTEFVERQWRIRENTGEYRPSLRDTSPIVTDGYVYSGGTLFDVRDGAGIWANSVVSGWAATDGERIIDSRSNVNGRLFGLDIEDGTEQWQVYLPGDEFKIPTVHDGSVFVGTDEGELLRIDAETGEVQWSRNSSVTSRFHGAPAIGDEALFIVATADSRFSDGHRNLYKIDLEDPYEREVLIDGTTSRRSPTFGDGLVYISDGAVLKAVDAATLTIRWEQDLTGKITGSAALTDDAVVAPITIDEGEPAGGLAALDTDDGSIRWQADTGPIRCAPVVAEETVFVGDEHGVVHAVDSTDGATRWTYDVDAAVVGSIAIADQTLYVRTDEGELIALTEQPNDAPVSVFSHQPEYPQVDESVSFDATGSHDDNGIASYEWQFTDDATAEGPQASHTFIEPGSHTVALTVTDIAGLTDTTRKTIEVRRESQIPAPAFSYSPSQPLAGEPVTFDATASSVPDGSITLYEWDFGAGFDQQGVEATHSFGEPGEYPVVLRVHDDDGIEATEQAVVTVRQERLNVSLTGMVTDVEVGDTASVTFSVTNFLTSEELTIQLLLETPSGVSISGVTGAREGSNQFTAVRTLEPSGHANIRIDFAVNEAGEHEVNALADYYFGGDQSDDGRLTETIEITAQQADEEPAETPDTDSTSDGPSESESGAGSDSEGDGSISDTVRDVVEDDEQPGFGAPGTITGLLGAGYLLKRRLDRSAEEDEPQR